jgi:hypothetical protein
VDPVVHIISGEGYAELDQFDDGWRCIGEATRAVETTKEKWCEADIHRTGGQLTLMPTDPNAKAKRISREPLQLRVGSR